MNQPAYVYILASSKNSTLYIGISSQLTKRIYAHKQKIIEGFTKQYAVDQLVYIEQQNPYWKDLWKNIIS